MGFKPTVDFLHLGTDRNRKFMSVASSTCPKPGAGQRHVLLFFFLTKIVMWVKQCHKPSPSHHHFYRWYKLYKPFPNGWFMIVFLTLIGYAMAPCFFCLSNAVLISCFSFWYQSSLMFAIVVVPRNLCASPNTSLQTYLRAIIHEVMRSFEQMAWNMC